MNKRLLSFLLLLVAAKSFAAGPVLYYVDITTGPNSGGYNNHGAVFCVYGKNFGSSRSTNTVTINGTEMADYVYWSNTRACGTVGSATTGNVVVTTGGGASTTWDGNPITFAVFTPSGGQGDIFWAGDTSDIGGSPGTPSDGNPGTLNQPKATTKACKNLVGSASGDICYVRGSVAAQTGQDTNGYNIHFTVAGSSSRPNVLMAWPGDAKPVIGNGGLDGVSRGMGAFNSGFQSKWWTIVGFSIISIEAFRTTEWSQGWRLIGNELQCPDGDGSAGCLLAQTQYNGTSGNPSLTIYGNEVHNAGCGEGITGDLDSSGAGNGQSYSFQCSTATANQSGTLATSDGTNFIITGDTTFPLKPGYHALMDSDGSGVQEELMVTAVYTSSFTATSSCVNCTALASSSFSGLTVGNGTSQWQYRPNISNKLYHPVYLGTDISHVKFAWNYIHHSNSIHGLNIHSTPPSDSFRTVSNVTTTTPPVFTVSGTTWTLVTPHLVTLKDITGFTDGFIWAVPLSSVTFSAYWDEALTSPVDGSGLSLGTTPRANKFGHPQFDIDVHDNVFESLNGSCSSPANVMPNYGAVTYYNNVFSNCGAGPDPAGDYSYHSSGIYLIKDLDRDEEIIGVGPIKFVNNTFYRSASFTPIPTGGTYGTFNMTIDQGTTVYLENNIIYQPNGMQFCDGGVGACANRFSGVTNVFVGTNTATMPSGMTGTITTDPGFVDVSTSNYHLSSSTSSANGAGTSSALVPDYDIDSVLRPSPPSIGAYEFSSEAVPPTPAPPRNQLKRAFMNRRSFLR